MTEALVVDWSGEDHEGEIAAFVSARLRALGVEVDLDTAEVYDEPGLGRGDIVPRVLDHLAPQVAEHGRTLAVRDVGDDAYHVLVLDSGEEAQAPVRAWGAQDPGGGSLVSLDCPRCDAMQVWDLPPGETLAGEVCDCGEPLFDADARPLPGVVLHS